MHVNGCADPAKKKRRHPLFVIPEAALCKCQGLCGGSHTYQAVFAVIAWSSRCMVDGHAPGTRHDDSPWSAHDRESRLARGVRLPCFALCPIGGGWAWYIEAFRFRSTYSCKCCFLCDAVKWRSGLQGRQRRSPAPTHADVTRRIHRVVPGCRRAAFQAVRGRRLAAAPFHCGRNARGRFGGGVLLIPLGLSCMLKCRRRSCTAIVRNV